MGVVDAVCTVAIPVYNRAQLVRRALDSALAQNVEGLEILVVDNCSTDGTWEALNEYSNPRLRLVRNERNVGLFGNFNRCLELAQGRYLRFLCSDDRLVVGCLEHEAALMEKHPEVVLLSTRAMHLDEAGVSQSRFAGLLRPGIYRGAEMIVGALWMFSHYMENPFNYPSGVMLRREAALRAGEFDAGFKQVGDVDYWLRVLEHGDAAVLDQVGCEVMIHSGQAGGATLFNDGTFLRECFVLAQRYAPQLHRANMYQEVVEQFAACALWAAFYCVRRRRPDLARLYWRMATGQGIAARSLFPALIRHIRLKALLRVFKSHHQPVMPCRSLEHEING